MQCPVCKVDNAQGPSCRRCKADLSLLFQLEAQREWNLVAARHYLRSGRWEDAVRAARRADGLRTDAESRRSVAIAALVTRTFAEAMRAYRSIERQSSLDSRMTR